MSWCPMKRQEVSDALHTDYQLYYDCQNVRVHKFQTFDCNK